MNIIETRVPFYVDHISDWNEIFQEINFNGHIIVNKIVTGCGFTEFFLNNPIPTVLCSPRKILLENKHEQHFGTTYLVKNVLEKHVYVDQDLGVKSAQKEAEVIADNGEYLKGLKKDISTYIQNCYISQIPPKILVTYDSLKHVLEAIFNAQVISLNQFQIVVDEFQSIFSDASFKASTELNFVGYLQNVPNVCYLSATPMLGKYLEQLDEFKYLPYYKLLWDERRLREHNFEKRLTRSLAGSCCDIIEDYLAGKFPVECGPDGKLIESKEVVFYINSIAEIKKIITRINKNSIRLTNDNTNVICSDNNKNILKLKSLGLQLGKVPLEGKPHKMFTFCTRTVYLGADFYSTCASTVICSDCNISCLALDISQDLPQIMGRQRKRENVFKDRAIFFYKEKINKYTKEEFDDFLEKKRQATLTTLAGYEKMNDSERKQYNKIFRNLVLTNKYKDDYVGVQESTGQAMYNRLVELRDIRSWEVSEYYKNHNTLYHALCSEGFNISEYKTEQESKIDLFLQEFNRQTVFENRIKMYCDFIDSEFSGDNTHPYLRRSNIPLIFHTYYNFFGSAKIRALGYYESILKKHLDEARESTGKILCEKIYLNFIENTKVSFSEIKQKLQEIYNELNLVGIAKAKDIQTFFETRDCSYNDKATGKRIRGYELLNKKKIL